MCSRGGRPTRVGAQCDHPVLRLSLADPLDHLIDERILARVRRAFRSEPLHSSRSCPKVTAPLLPDCSAFVAYSASIVTSL